MKVFLSTFFLSLGLLLQAHDLPLDYLYMQWATGDGPYKRTHVKVAEVGVGKELYKRDPKSSWFFATLEGNWTGFFAVDKRYSAAKQTVHTFAANLNFRWIVPEDSEYLKKFAVRPWIQVGSGPVYFLSRHVAYSGNVLSTNLQFGSQGGVGVRYGPGWHGELGIFWKHYSNANIKYPNYGLDIVEFRAGYWF